MLVDVMTFASYFSIAKKEINDLRGPHLFIDQGRAFDTGDSGHSAPLLEDLGPLIIGGNFNAAQF